MKHFYLLFLILTLFLSCSFVKPKVIPDKNLAAAVRAGLGLDPNEPILEEDLRELEYLVAAGREIKNLNGLEKAVNLRSLWLGHSKITNIIPLTALTQLTYLNLSRNEIRDITPIQNMKSIRELRKQMPNLQIMESNR